MKLITLQNLSTFADEIKTRYAKKETVEALSQRVDAIAAAGGEPNVINAIKVNGTAQAITDKAVDITMPTKVSDLTNDSKFQTDTDVAAAVAAADHLKRKPVTSVDEINLEAADASQYIYMVPKEGGKNGDKYDEYMVIDGKLEPVGDWAVDLSAYMKTTDVETITSAEVTALLADEPAGE